MRGNLANALGGKTATYQTLEYGLITLKNVIETWLATSKCRRFPGRTGRA